MIVAFYKPQLQAMFERYADVVTVLSASSESGQAAAGSTTTNSTTKSLADAFSTLYDALGKLEVRVIEIAREHQATTDSTVAKNKKGSVT